MASHLPQSPKFVTVPTNPEGSIYFSGPPTTYSLSWEWGSVSLTLTFSFKAMLFPQGESLRVLSSLPPQSSKSCFSCFLPCHLHADTPSHPSPKRSHGQTFRAWVFGHGTSHSAMIQVQHFAQCRPTRP